MKLKYINRIILFGVITLSFGCKKWLDANPKTQIREELLLVDEQGFKDVLTGIYLKMGDSTLYGQNLTMGFLDVMAQSYTGTTIAPYAQASVYNYADAGVKNVIRDIWNNSYSAIANLDNLLLQVDAKKNIFTGDNYSMIKGQALGLRAYLHFDLLRLFGKAPLVGMSAPSIPYVTSFGVKTFPLLPVGQVIDSCLTDLANAQALLSVNKTVSISYSPDPTSNYMNYWAAKGLEARIDLYKGDKAKAKLAAMEIINNQDKFPFVKSTSASASANRDRLYATEHLFALNVFNLKSYTEQFTKTTSSNAPTSLSTSKARFFSVYEVGSGNSTDIRFNYDFVVNAGSYSTSKYWQDNFSNQAELSFIKNIVPMIRLSEMYYIAAECSDVASDGVVFLNTVRKHRGLTLLPDSIISKD